MRMEEIRLSFQGIRVAVRIYTPDTDRIAHRAILVSSPVSDLHSWHRLAVMMAEAGCLFVTADLPGFGKCPCVQSAPQDNDTRAQILWGILDEVEKLRGEEQTKWHLIGHGNGAAAVLSMALYQPDSTLSRVLISPVVDRFLFAPIHALIASNAGESLTLKWHQRYVRSKKRFRKLAEKIYGARIRKDRLIALHKMMNRKAVAPLLTRVIRESFTLNESVYDVKTPVMLIWGSNDRIFGGQIPPRLKKKLSHAEMHLVPSAHMSMETHPDMLRDYLRGWLRFSEGREKALIRKDGYKR